MLLVLLAVLAGDAREEVLGWLNAEREKRGAAALVIDASLERAAQARAEEVAGQKDFAAAEISGDEISRRAAEAGYEALVIGQIVMTVIGSPEGRLERLSRQSPETFAQAMRKEHRDLGVGIAQTEDALIWVLLFGLSAEDDFQRKTAALSDLTKVREQMLARVNTERKALRLPHLHENALLDRAAQNHAEDMIRRSYYGHESPEGATVSDRARRAGYRASTVGENIAEGPGNVAEVMDAWMESPVHRDHIVSLVLKEIGIGLAFGRNDRGWEIVWVQVFGAPRPGEPVGRRPPRRGA
ncbi:MAG: CAP domain-containing protein [Thermoanaerobaculia bacterium]